MTSNFEFILNVSKQSESIKLIVVDFYFLSSNGI